MRKTESLSTGRFTFNVNQLGALQGRKVFLRVIRIIGPALQKAASSKDEGKSEQETLLSVVAEVAATAKEEDLDYFCEVFGSNTMVSMDGGPSQPLNPVFDLVFCGEYGAMLEWLAFCIKLNFGNFMNAASLGNAQPA